jgi:hypothetical protein
MARRLERLESGLGHADKDTVVDSEETKELEDLSGIWCEFSRVVFC